MTSLPITWGHVTLFPVTWLLPPASFSLVGLKCIQNPSFRPSIATSKWLPVKWRHFRGTTGHVRSRDVFCCHVTETSRVLQPCRSSNVYKTQVAGLLQQLPGHFRSNYFRLICDHVRSRDVISCHVTATSCELQPCRSSNVYKTQVDGLIQQLPGHFRSNYFTSGSFVITWGHVRSFPATWWLHSASFSPVGAQTYPNSTYKPSTATSRWLPVKWRHFRVISGHVVTWGHFLPHDGHILQVSAS